MTAVASSPSSRSARLGLRATPEQEVVLRRAAEVAHKSLTDFILDSACLAAEQTLLDQRLFMVSGSQYQALMDLLERPEQTNDGLRAYFRPRRTAFQSEGGHDFKLIADSVSDDRGHRFKVKADSISS